MVRNYEAMAKNVEKNPMTDEEVEQLNSLLEKFLGTKLGIEIGDFYDIPIPLTILPNWGDTTPVEVKLCFLEQGRGSLVAFANTTDSGLEKYFKEEEENA